MKAKSSKKNGPPSRMEVSGEMGARREVAGCIAAVDVGVSKFRLFERRCCALAGCWRRQHQRP